MARRFRMRVLAVVAVLALVAFGTPPARGQDPTFQGPPTVAPFDSDGDGRADTARVTQVVHVPQGNTTATVAGHLFPPSADPNASWSGWVDSRSVTQDITCASGSGCNRTFNLDLRAGPNAAGRYIVVLNVTRTPTLVHAIVKGSAAGGTFPGSIAVDDGGFLGYREALDSAIAEIAYRSASGSGVNATKTRIWDDPSWTAATEQPTAGSSIRAIRTAWSPTAGNERIFVVQGNDGWLDAYVCTPTCTVTNNVGQVWSTPVPATPERRFDLAYESLSGEAVLVYGVLSPDAARDLAYKTYSAGAWSGEQYLNDAGHATDVQYTLVKLAAQMGSNQIGLVAGDFTNNDVNAWIWNGTAFGSVAEITASSVSPNQQQADLAWESASGNLVVVAAQGGSTNIAWREFTTGWSLIGATFRCINTAWGLWLSLKANPVPTENTMVLSAGDTGSDLSTCYWNGAGWANWRVQDSSLDFTTARSFDFAWHPSGNAGLLAYGTSVGQITFRTFTAPNTWSAASSVPMGANPHRWVQLRTNPSPGVGGVRVLGAVLEDGANDLGAVAWDGTGLAAGAADGLTGDTGSALYESFDLAPARVGAHRLLVRYDWTNVSSAPSHTLIIKGYRGDEDGAVQVLSPPVGWTTRLTISATANSLYTYTLTGTEYNGGSPSVRLVDQGGFDSTPSDLWIDWAALRLDGTPVGAAMYSTVTFDGSSTGNPLGFEFGLNPITLAVILIPTAALFVVILLLRLRRRGPRPAYAGDTALFEREPDREDVDNADEDEEDEAEEEVDDEEEEVEEEVDEEVEEEVDEEATDSDEGDPWRDDEGGAEDGEPDPGDPDSREPEHEEPPVPSNRGGDRERTKLYP